MKKTNVIPDVIRATVVEFEQHPYDINCGNCEEFARVVEEKCLALGVFVTTHWTDTAFCSHCYIKHNGKYYDSEEPEGVRSHKQLPLAVRAQRTEREYKRRHKADKK